MANPVLPRVGFTTNVDSLTFENVLRELADNVSKGTPFLDHLDMMGQVTAGGGKRLDVPLHGARNSTFKSVGRTTALTTADDQIFTRAGYEWGTIAGTVTIYDRDRLENNGDQQILDFVSELMMDAYDQARETLNAQLLSAETAARNGGSNVGFNGLGHLVAAPNTVAVGGITPNNNNNTYPTAFWQAKTRTDRPANYSNATLRTDLADFVRDVSVNRTKPPDLIVTNRQMYNAIEERAWDKAQLEGRGGQEAVNFMYPKFEFGSALVTYDETIGQASGKQNRIYVLNSMCFEFAKLSGGWGEMGTAIRAETILADYYQLAFYGQLAIKSRRYNGWWDQATS